MAVVRRDTIAVLLEAEHPPVLVFPGQYLKPALVPSRSPIVVLVVNTAPVNLDVTVTRLQTADGAPVDEVNVRVTVQLSGERPLPRGRRTGRRTRPAARGHLLERVRLEVAAEIHAAVTMSVIEDLRGERLQQVLAGRWQPRGFAGGALVRPSYRTQGTRRTRAGAERAGRPGTEGRDARAVHRSRVGPAAEGPGLHLVGRRAAPATLG